MMSKVWKNTNDTKVWNRCTRYERQHKVWKMWPRYTTGPQRYEMIFQVWNTCFLEKQWVFIPLWVYFIPFWVWKKSLFFPDGHTGGFERGYLSVFGYLHPSTPGRILGWTPTSHSADVCFTSCGYASEFCTGRPIEENIQWDLPLLLKGPRGPTRSTPSVLEGNTLFPMYPSSWRHAYAQTYESRNLRPFSALLLCRNELRTSPWQDTSSTWPHVLGGTHPLWSRLSRHLLPRAAHPEALPLSVSSGAFSFILSILWWTFSPLCLCDLSIQCLHIHSLCVYAITSCSSCLSWGVYRESLGSHFSFYNWFFDFYIGSVPSPPISVFCTSSLALYLEGHIYLKRRRSSDQPDTSIPAASKIAQIDL
jgi:hypothetical protein